MKTIFVKSVIKHLQRRKHGIPYFLRFVIWRWSQLVLIILSRLATQKIFVLGLFCLHNLSTACNDLLPFQCRGSGTEDFSSSNPLVSTLSKTYFWVLWLVSPGQDWGQVSILKEDKDIELTKKLQAYFGGLLNLGLSNEFQNFVEKDQLQKDRITIFKLAP